MKSFTTRRFREAYRSLPGEVRLQARRAFHLFQQNPSHPGLNFKKVVGENNVYSVRIGLGYRALGRVDDDAIVWSWIGPHADYDKLV
jgi:mRNA-degrading endonuclease RelE of RelBE toxin-antitoxin system